MRLRPEKIEQLAELVYSTLGPNSQIKLTGVKEDALFLIRKVITEDLEAEDEIQAEAQKILDDHADDMRRMGVNHAQMLQKTMKKLARDRGMVL